jgi:hypothetical protein
MTSTFTKSAIWQSGRLGSTSCGVCRRSADCQDAREDGSLVVGKLIKNSTYDWEFNAATREFEDLVVVNDRSG